MQRKIRALIVALTLATPATAQHALHCRDLDPTAEQDAFRAFECVSKLDADLEAATARADALESALAALTARVKSLEDTGAVPSVGAHENTKAIVAYVSDKGEKTCPRGWSPYEPAKDRFLLGAGGKYPVVGTLGGEEAVTLSEAHMPSHRHGIPMVTAPHEYLDNGLGTNAPYFDYRGRTDVETEIGDSRPDQGVYESGGNQPHNNMPPYIELYFCKKD